VLEDHATEAEALPGDTEAEAYPPPADEEELTQQRSHVENQFIQARASTSAGIDLEWLEERLPDTARQIGRWVMRGLNDTIRGDGRA
jgi:hypothetical protein